jgi:hypothetical protein
LLVTALRYFNQDMPPAQVLEIYARHLLEVHGFAISDSDDLLSKLEETLERRLDFVRLALRINN